jgi:hypothetical protein
MIRLIREFISAIHTGIVWGVIFAPIVRKGR